MSQAVVLRVGGHNRPFLPFEAKHFSPLVVETAFQLPEFGQTRFEGSLRLHTIQR